MSNDSPAESHRSFAARRAAEELAAAAASEFELVASLRREAASVYARLAERLDDSRRPAN